MKLSCPHCAHALFQAGSDKLKARTSILVLHKSGAVEINCAHCRQGVLLPLQLIQGEFALQKAVAPKLVVSNHLTTMKRARHK